ncbi:MAG: hypothetical protein H0T68_10460 [Gemmatimonadales bacterium]|nr:hypothetical protein [Gemmatimonadales bacterium]
MRNGHGRLAATARAAVVALVALASATPVSAQLGGDAGTIVLTADMVERLVAGLEAGEAERQVAAKEDTPYDRHSRAVATYETAKSKCQQGQQTFANRMAADEKMMDEYNALINEMVEAQGRGDSRVAMAYNDSAMAMQDPSCIVKEPQQPGDYYAAQREIDSRAERQAMKASGFTRSELAQVRERAEAVLRGGTPPGDLSASETKAVSARAGELKPLLGIQDPPPPGHCQGRAGTAGSGRPARGHGTSGASAMGECVTRNAAKHENELRALGERAEAAQQAGNTGKLMAIADTMQQLQMAGCQGAR